MDCQQAHQEVDNMLQDILAADSFQSSILLVHCHQYKFRRSMTDRKMWFANYLYCIKRWAIGQYASGYMDCRLFPVLYIFLVHCHWWQIDDVLHTYAICYSYITVGVAYLCFYTKSEAKPETNVNNKDILQLATVT